LLKKTQLSASTLKRKRKAEDIELLFNFAMKGRELGIKSFITCMKTLEAKKGVAGKPTCTICGLGARCAPWNNRRI
jgi:hypothetical protein